VLDRRARLERDARRARSERDVWPR
jgi:hypothetical protein